MDNDDWAEDHGYSRGRCPSCRATIWMESCCAVECDNCGWTDTPRDENEFKDTETPNSVPAPAQITGFYDDPKPEGAWLEF